MQSLAFPKYTLQSKMSLGSISPTCKISIKRKFTFKENVNEESKGNLFSKNKAEINEGSLPLCKYKDKEGNHYFKIKYDTHNVILKKRKTSNEGNEKEETNNKVMTENFHLLKTEVQKHLKKKNYYTNFSSNPTLISLSNLNVNQTQSFTNTKSKTLDYCKMMNNKIKQKVI